MHGWNDAAQDVVLIGGPGTGKTQVATAIGLQAIEHHRRKVRVFSTIELVNALEQKEAKGKGKAGQIAKAMTRLDLVVHSLNLPVGGGQAVARSDPAESRTKMCDSVRFGQNTILQ